MVIKDNLIAFMWFDSTFVFVIAFIVVHSKGINGKVAFVATCHGKQAQLMSGYKMIVCL